MSSQCRESNGNGIALLWQQGDKNLRALLDENHCNAVAAVQQQFLV